MSSRIYPKEVFDREVDRLRSKYYYCPKCYSNNISNADGYFTLVYEYKCYGCKNVFLKKEALTLNDIRNLKINKIIK
jgi:transposase-like protein